MKGSKAGYENIAYLEVFDQFRQLKKTILY